MNEQIYIKYIEPYLAARIQAIQEGQSPPVSQEELIEEASKAFGVNPSDLRYRLTTGRDIKTQLNTGITRKGTMPSRYTPYQDSKEFTNYVPAALAATGAGILGYGGYKKYKDILDDTPTVSGITPLFQSAELFPEEFKKVQLPFNMISKFGPTGPYGNAHPRMVNVNGISTPVRDENGKIIKGPLVDNRGNIIDPVGFLTALHTTASTQRIFAFETGLDKLGITQEYLDDLYYNKPLDVKWDPKRTPADNLRINHRNIMDTSYALSRKTPGVKPEENWGKRTLAGYVDNPESLWTPLYMGQVGKWLGKKILPKKLGLSTVAKKTPYTALNTLAYYNELFGPSREYMQFRRDSKGMQQFADHGGNPEDYNLAHHTLDDPYTAYRKKVLGLDPDQDILDKYKNPISATYALANAIVGGGTVQAASPAIRLARALGKLGRLDMSGIGDAVEPGFKTSYLLGGKGKRIAGLGPEYAARYGWGGLLGPLGLAGWGTVAAREIGHMLNKTERTHLAADYKRKHGWKEQHANALARKAKGGKGPLTVKDLFVQSTLSGPRQVTDTNKWVMTNYANEFDMPLAQAYRNYQEHMDALTERKKRLGPEGLPIRRKRNNKGGEGITQKDIQAIHNPSVYPDKPEEITVSRRADAIRQH